MAEGTRYTLTSYDPVSISVEIPYATADDVQDAMTAMAEREEGTEATIRDASWVKKHLGYDSLMEFTKAARRKAEQELEEAAMQMRDLYCVAELSKRLEQDPGEELFKPIREDAALRLKFQLDQNSMSLRLFMARNNLDVDSLNKLLDDQAMAEARSQAALAAFAAERGITAEESEWADLLGLPKDVARNLFNKARGTEKYDSYARAAVNAKALRTVVAEADCTIVHETADEARRRVAGER